MNLQEWNAENTLLLDGLAGARAEIALFAERGKDKTRDIELREKWKQLARESKERLRLLERLKRAHDKRKEKAGL